MEETIKVLTDLENIRLRPEMYIGVIEDGSMEEDGIYQLLKLIIQNSVEEFTQGYGDIIDIYLYDGSAAVSDRGEGIPHERLESRTNVKIKCGMMNVLPIVNALSEEFTVTSYRNNKTSDILYRKGVLQNMSSGEYSGIFSKIKTSGTTITFTPDSEIFGKVMFDSQIVADLIQVIESQNPGLQIRLNDKTPDGQRRYIKNALKEYQKDIQENIEQLTEYIDNMDTFTDEQVESIDLQWFHIEHALDTGVGMLGEGVGRLESEINGEE